MSDNTVKVTVVADQKDLDDALDFSVEKLKKAAAGLDIFNAAAVKAFFETAEATKKLNAELGATTAQLEKLDGVTQAVADKADAAGVRMANAFERGARGISVMARQGTVAMRSLDQIIAAGADIAFAFGPEGAIVSGIMMVTAGIIGHVESTEQRMIELSDKYTEHLMDMVANSSLTEVAKASADAYIGELEAQSKLLRDKQIGTWAAIFGATPSLNPLDAVIAKFRIGGEERTRDEKHGVRDAADEAGRIIQSIDGSEKDLEKLKTERERLNRDIAGAEEHLRGLDKDKNEHEIAETEARLSAARHKLADTEAITRQLESDRAARLSEARAEAQLAGNGILDAALENRGKRFKTADITQEHEQRDEDVSLSSRGGTGRKQDQEDARKQRERDARLESEKRAQELMQEIEDQITQRHLRALGLREAADVAAANHEYSINAARIQNMKVSEETKTRLLVAAQRDRDEKMADVLETSAEDSVKAAIKVLDHQLKVEEQARHRREVVVEGVEKNLARALVNHHKDMGREILRALLEPEVKHLEALGAKQFVMGSADAALGNYGGAAEHFAAGALYEAGATLLASLGGSSGGGGGAGAGGGGGASSATAMGASGNNSSSQTIQLEIVNVTKDQSGRETARTNQRIQRLTDLNTPIRVTL